MNKEIETIRASFLAAPDLDDEERAENEKTLKEWEDGLIQNTVYVEWQNHDITKEIAAKMKDEYRDFALQLASNRALTDEQRRSIWARQDACMFILSLTEKDAKGELERIEREIRRAVSMT